MRTLFASILAVLMGFFLIYAVQSANRMEDKTTFSTSIFSPENEIVDKLLSNLKIIQLSNENIFLKLSLMEQKLKDLESITKALQTDFKSFSNNFEERIQALEQKNTNTGTEISEQLEFKLNSTADNIVKILQTKVQNQESKKPDPSQNEFHNFRLTFKEPENCAEAFYNTRKSNGIYKLYIRDFGFVDAYCMSDPSDNTAPTWTIIQRNPENLNAFDKDWDEYKDGFGNLEKSFWFGLERLHILTTRKNYELWIYIKDMLGNEYNATYKNFVVGSEFEHFKITKLGEFSGNAPNNLVDSVGQPFKVNDFTTNKACNPNMKGGFWATPGRSCSSNLNSYPDIFWNSESQPWRVVFTQMAIRPIQLEI